MLWGAVQDGEPDGVNRRVLGLFFAANILACCINPARSLAAPAQFQVRNRLQEVGNGDRCDNRHYERTIKSSIRLNPSVRSRRR